MRALPNIDGHTVANWPLQENDLTDHSGNGLDLTAIDYQFHTPSTAVWTELAPDFVGLDLGVTTRTGLGAPLSTLYQFTGPFTFEWVMATRYTYTQTYFCCAAPPTRVGNPEGYPSAVGSLYTLLWDTHPLYCDQFYGGGGGVTTGLACEDATGATWSDVDNPWVDDPHPHLYAITRNAAGTVTWYRDGVAYLTTVPKLGTNVATGAERVYIGSTEADFGSGSAHAAAAWFASVRLLDVALTPDEVASNAFYVFGSGEPDEGIVYDAVAAAQFGVALRQEPRS